MLTLLPPAKINLTLEVLGKRPDGYHDILSIMQSIDLVDTLSLEPHATLDFDCDVEELSTSENLAMRAFLLLQERTGCRKGARIRLRKGIPWGCGLGGGSSDAAAILLGLNQLWELGLSPGQLLELASEMGSDVPFFIWGGTALVEGRGEKVSPLPHLIPQEVLLLIPPVRQERKTALLYANLDESHFSRGEATRRLLTILRAGQPLASSLLFNAFDGVAQRLFPQLESYRRLLHEVGAKAVHLAGSGPALFTLVGGEGKDMLTRLRSNGLEAYLTRTTRGSKPG